MKHSGLWTPRKIVQPKPQATGPIKSFWAIVSVDPSGNEGIVAKAMVDFKTGEQLRMPLIAADEVRKGDIVDLARTEQMPPGYKMKLIKFTTREECDVDLSAQLGGAKKYG